MSLAFLSAPPPLLSPTLPGTVHFSRVLAPCEHCRRPCSDCPDLDPHLLLGCGPDPSQCHPENLTIGLDVLDFGQTVIHNLEFPLPFPSQFAQSIAAHHVLEHIHNVHQLLCEIWRVLKFEGTAEIVVPFFQSPNAPGDLSHVRSFSAFSLDYLLGTSATNHPLSWPYPPFALAAKTIPTSQQITWSLLKT